jgi:hypothetical protein
VGAIEEYVAQLGAALKGPRRTKADLVREARDGLLDAAEAYACSGLSPDQAERQAVADFGTVAQVAPAFQQELGYAQSTRTALLVGLVLAPQDFLWDLVSPDAAPAAGLYGQVSALTSPLGAIALLGSVAAVALGGRVPWIIRATGFFSYGVAAVFVATGLLLVFSGPTPPLAVAGLPAALVLVIAPMFVVARSARRCLAAAPVTHR